MGAFPVASYLFFNPLKIASDASALSESAYSSDEYVRLSVIILVEWVHAQLRRRRHSGKLVPREPHGHRRIPKQS